MAARIRQLPLWLRYAFALVCAVIIVVALVLFVDAHQQPLVETPANPTRSERAAEYAQDRIVMTQEQAPRVAQISGSNDAVKAASVAVTRYFTEQVNEGQIQSPGALDGAASCRISSASAARTALSCNVVAGDQAQNKSQRFPFDAVVTGPGATVTFCEVVTSPDPGLTPPAVSARCR